SSRPEGRSSWLCNSSLIPGRQLTRHCYLTSRTASPVRALGSPVPGSAVNPADHERVDLHPALAPLARAVDLLPEPTVLEPQAREAGRAADERAIAEIERGDDDRPVLDPEQLD